MLDPISNAERTGEPELRGGTPAGGRRKFGDACLADSQALRRAANPQFLRHGPDGIIACQILLLPGFELNELSALTEAFECANRMLCERLFDWHLASLDGEPVRSAGGLAISVARPVLNSDHRHLFLLSAYGGADLATPLSALLCRRYATGTHIAAIGGACALLAETGLLATRPCAAHWSLTDALTERAKTMEIADRLYAIDERIATCAGRDATLDFALRLIADAAGDRLARIVADSLNHARPREANEPQLSELDFSGQRGTSAIAHTVATMRRRMMEGEDLVGIAAHSGVSQRQLQRLFRRHLGMTPTQYFLKARLQRARHMLQYSTLSVTEIAIATGFASISHFTRRYTELYGRTPTAERGRTPRRSRNTASVSKTDFALVRSAA
ncbi:GlxA family transcriptional regulator [Dongia deserti]|uniref:GlxA family transcriptional regulator n=1 Tax=Dongia deserti TaxID=2268030 RepID=UPI000E654F0B|nr:helix-turn-helix domain-containing protein [Dongia deserti]